MEGDRWVGTRGRTPLHKFSTAGLEFFLYGLLMLKLTRSLTRHGVTLLICTGSQLWLVGSCSNPRWNVLWTYPYDRLTSGSFTVIQSLMCQMKTLSTMRGVNDAKLGFANVTLHLPCWRKVNSILAWTITDKCDWRLSDCCGPLAESSSLQWEQQTTQTGVTELKKSLC